MNNGVPPPLLSVLFDIEGQGYDIDTFALLDDKITIIMHLFCLFKVFVHCLAGTTVPKHLISLYLLLPVH